MSHPSENSAFLHRVLRALDASTDITNALNAAPDGAVPADVLDFIQRRVLGRIAVGEARAQIQHLRESTTILTTDRLVLGQVDNTRSRLSKAKAKHRGAGEALHKLTAKTETRQEALGEIGTRVDETQSQLSHTKSINILLGVLGRKERFRQRRFEEIHALLTELHQHISTVDGQQNVDMFVGNELDSSGRYLPVSSHVEDALASLAAHHVNLAQNASGSTRPAKTRLQHAIARILKLEGSDSAVTTALEQILSKIEAQARTPAFIPPPVPEASIEQLTRANDELERTETHLQQSLDDTLALAHAYAHHLTELSSFEHTSAPTLTAALDEERARVSGYVNSLHEHLVSPPHPSASQQPDLQGWTLAEVKDAIMLVHRRNSLSSSELPAGLL